MVCTRRGGPKGVLFTKIQLLLGTDTGTGTQSHSPLAFSAYMACLSESQRAPPPADCTRTQPGAGRLRPPAAA